MKFEKVSYEAFNSDMIRCGFHPEDIMDAYNSIEIPKRKTKHSAGYDFITPVNCWIGPHKTITVPTGIKAYFRPEEAKMWHLSLYIRSSVGISRGVVIANQTGVIDADYYNNPDNEGDILIALKNTNDFPVSFMAGSRVMQGIFEIHGITSDDNADGARTGGIGSTDERTD